MLSSLLSYWPQWLVILMMLLRAGRVINADICDTKTRKMYGIRGIILCELTFNTIVLFLLWAGGFFSGAPR